MRSYLNISEMIGKTFVSVKDVGDELVFTEENGDLYRFYHPQSCCENVFIESIVGELDDLAGNPILVAEEVTNHSFEDPLSSSDESYTWTFYKFATIKGHVDVRWYGTSNGYYSESVDLVREGKGD